MSADLPNNSAVDEVGLHGQLLQSLVPRAQSFAYYLPDRSCAWSSDGGDDSEIDNYVAELPPAVLNGTGTDTGPLRRTLTSGRTVLGLAVRSDEAPTHGLLIVAFSRNEGKSSWFDPDAVKSALNPAVRLMAASLHVNRRLAAETGRATEAEQELKLVYQIDEKIHGSSRSHARLAQLVGQSGRFLGIAYSVLLMPAKRIRISATHSSWKAVNRKSLDKYLIDKLFPRLKGRRAPVIFEIPAVPGSTDLAEQGYQTLVCPLVDRFGNLEGMLAQLGRIDRQPFKPSHSRFMSHIVRKVAYVIEQSFDAMTGLMNRAGFQAQLEEAMKSLSGKDDVHHVMYFDLDNLHLVNDTFGQQAGDEVVTRFAQILEEALPKNAVATRLTGDDFAILLTHSVLDDAVDLARAVQESSRDLRYLQGDKSLQVTVSAGVAPLLADTADGEAAVTAARIACDSAKDHGRDRVEVYDRDDQSIVRRYDDMHLVAEIQKTLDADGFVLFAQPIVSLAGRNGGRRFEVLLRMKDSTGNKISSKSFFSAAERYQLMPQIDRWVVSTVMRKLSPQASRLVEAGVSFAINLSGQTLGDDGILNFIEEELEASGVAPGTLCFEVTESAAVSNRAKAQDFIDALRARGCRFSLDDFGAGLSSFAYLKNFKVDTLKIDGSFIRDITKNRISESMVAAITQVARVMNLETVAEYVENAETREVVARLGVDYAQGHSVGKPVALEEILAAL
ncbi:MAG TPA: EAL domain-containing protein [Woeseiaceae bacterium]|nr:EAL domain-containing protein [Woeseiaceae bacterium]